MPALRSLLLVVVVAARATLRVLQVLLLLLRLPAPALLLKGLHQGQEGSLGIVL